jgi:hypothetical protein
MLAETVRSLSSTTEEPMAHKLALHLDALTVDSFATGAAQALPQGTVHAHDAKIPCPSAGYPQSCATLHTCASFDRTCRADEY